ncbi:helix-turn-helix transcriptional regulator [Streptomyces sp. NPDC008079]|uniref:helix-turn-helix transcriptional regulator n=1 Tax=Streptomyces sp. NPDC008079 TaxID=3364806 RepID=UPI0036E5C49E
MPDPEADYWTVTEVADYLGVTPETVRTYRSRKRGELPPEDKMFGRSPAWKPATITRFDRLGQGHRSDLE